VIRKEVLIIDDEASIRQMHAEVLEDAGYTVRSAVSGEEALEILKEKYYHVIFLDLNLPGMNGIEVGRRIKQTRPLTVLYAVTGYATLFELSECIEAGFEDYFKKPMDLARLVKAADDAHEKITRWRKR
jgi:CheY-like chemotaxis protein